MPITFRVTVSPDLGPLLSRLHDFGILTQTAHDSLKASTELLQTQLVAASPRGRGDHGSDSKRLFESWKVIDNGLIFQVANDAPQLRYVIKGNDPGGGWIYPKTAQMLRFSIDGDTIFASRVRASKPNDFVTPIIQRWKPEATRIMGGAVKTYARWLAKGDAQ